jgi:RNA 3'-terminal phosphate cyclase (ATP)
MITIDGSQGEGGGQILRSSLSLSAITGTPVRLVDIRARRPKPGLQRQHLACVQAAGRICNAQVDGAELGAREVTFAPQGIVAGNYHFAIGSAGSASLVLQTVLPPLLRAAGPSTVTIEGGTHNSMAPPFEFLRDSFLPVLARIGATVELRLERHGFHPAGGGRIVAVIQPLVAPWPLELDERGQFLGRHARAVVANLPAHVAHREIETIKHQLKWSYGECDEEEVQADGPGNVVSITLRYANVTEVVTGFGELRTRAEEVARTAATEAQRWLDAGAPVGPHLADQLLLPLAIAAGGRFRTSAPTDHTTTNAAVIAAFLGERVTLRELGPHDWQVQVRGP